MRHLAWAAVTLVVMISLPTLAQPGVTEAHRDVRRMVASPGPVGSVAFLSDQVAWSVHVPEETVVEVTAVGTSTSWFYLRANRTLAGFWIPGPAGSIVLDEPGPWRVEVDPAAGVQVDIHITFRGFVAGQGGKPSPFVITDLEAQRGCVAVGVCLP